jgi:hypothetical protein
MNQVQQADVVRLDLPASYKYLNGRPACVVLERSYADTPMPDRSGITVYDAPRQLWTRRAIPAA